MDPVFKVGDMAEMVEPNTTHEKVGLVKGALLQVVQVYNAGYVGIKGFKKDDVRIGCLSFRLKHAPTQGELF